jgi:alkylhydroperoxidase/carboxymuconolactone decarboxylase family protein YurZ
VDDVEDALRKLMLHDDAFIESALGCGPHGACGLDPKTLALLRIAALIAIGGSLTSFLSRVEAALIEDATPEEIVGVLIGIAPEVGDARAAAAASSIGPALGFDVSPRATRG